ncbi:hypothetical protein Pla52nx_001437 [Stieleria varia]|uniref:Uncharacterized protein n=2 Tax=Stieleria varia TaxID=2528005 RepID=A0A5C6A3P4_9BACT|nr:hypothetical protein Pla52n_53430 [Stieleria varia]
MANLVAAAEPSLPAVAPAPTNSLTLSTAQARQSVQWLVDLAISKMPPTYDGDKHWGDQKKVWAGVSIKREGLELKTHRRFREVNHGRWIKYHLELPPSPAGSSSVISAVIRDVRPLHDTVGPDSATAINSYGASWEIDAELETPIEFEARIERWNLGVQFFSINVVGKMNVRLKTTSTISFYGDYSELPPALVIDPQVTAATLELSDIRVDRISKVGGDVAEQWGEMVEKLARDVFLPELNEKLPGKLNKSIAKKKDDLRFSLASLLSQSFTVGETETQPNVTDASPGDSSAAIK